MKVISVLICVLALVGCVAFAQSDAQTFYIENIPSNGTAGVAAGDYQDQGPISGMIEGIILDLSGYASPTVDVDVVTVANRGTGASRTIFSSNGVPSDLYLPIRVPAYTTAGINLGSSNLWTRIPLVEDVVRVQIYNANTNAVIDAKAVIIFDK